MPNTEPAALEAVTTAAVRPLPVRLLIFAAIVAGLVYLIIYLRKRIPIVAEFMLFLKVRKLWWMTPIVVIFFLLAVLIVTMAGPLSPFLYIFW